MYIYEYGCYLQIYVTGKYCLPENNLQSQTPMKYLESRQPTGTALVESGR